MIVVSAIEHVVTDADKPLSPTHVLEAAAHRAMDWR
jgi:hypothetical protein